MKKIITLSIVCLASGQLFAQTNSAKAQPAEAKTKTQIEAQKQAEVNGMSLKQATDAGVVVVAPATSIAPTAPKVATQKTAVITEQKAVAVEAANTETQVKQATKEEIAAKVALDAKLNQQAKQTEATKATKKEQ